jgi:predicted ArsR family transcriptional regulator
MAVAEKKDWTTMTTRERILSITEGEVNPRIWTYADQLAMSPGAIRRHLNKLVDEGKLEFHRRGRGNHYWTLVAEPDHGEWVKGYTRKDGVEVRGHWRTHHPKATA